VIFKRAAREIGMTWKWSSKIALSSMNVPAWVAVLAYGAWFVARTLRSRRWGGLLVLLPVLVLCYPLTRFVLSPKYLVPALMFVPLMLAYAAREVQDRIGAVRFRWLATATVAACALVMVVCVSPRLHFPFVEFQTRPKSVWTADGERSFGAYLRTFSKIGSPFGDRADGGFIKLDRRLAGVVRGRSEDVVIICQKQPDNFFYDEWSWPWLSFYLQCDGYRLVEYSEMDRMVLGKDGRRVEVRFVPGAVEDWRGEPMATVIRLPFIPRSRGYHYDLDRLEQFYGSLRQQFDVGRFPDEPPLAALQ
jgi:hypothetical protein